MKVKTNAAFSGKMLLDGNAVSFSGKFALDGTTNKTVFRTKVNKAPIALNLQLDFGADQVFGTISTSNRVANLLADRVVFYRSNLHATNFSGKYTVIIPGGEDAELVPVGYGYGVITVKTNGKVSLSGLLADRHTVKQTAYISTRGDWPFFAPLYRGISTFHDGTRWITNKDTKGSLIGWLTITNAPTDALNGTVNWTKKGWTNNIYAAGFTNEADVLGSVFKPRTIKGVPLLNMTNGTASFFAGNLPFDVTHSFTMTTNSVFVTSSKTNLTLSLSASSGAMKGSFRHPVSGIPVLFYGAVLQEQNFGGGFFLGTNQSGLMLLEGN